MPHRTEYAPACAQPGADPDLWYREDAESLSIARRLCNGCELKDACLSYAMTMPDEDQWGMWGGETAAARRARRAADPERWPVSVGPLQEFLGTRGDRFGDHWHESKLPRDANGRVPYGEYTGHARPAVDWAAVDAGDLEDRVTDLLARYQDETELGYALTDASGMVTPVNDEAAA